MSLRNRVANAVRGLKSAETLIDLPEMLGWGDARSGVAVNYTTALQVMTVLACCKVLSEGVAQVPLKIFKQRTNGAGADAATSDPLYRLLYRKPNGWQTSFEFRETLMLHLALCGNSFVFKSMNSFGKILELILIEPGKVQVTRQADLSLRYTITSDDGVQKTFDQSMIWHARGLSWNGWMGMETIKLAREAIGLSIALEQAHAELHAHGGQPGGVYSVSGDLTDVQHTQLTKWVKERVSGANRFNPLILDRAATWVTQQMTGVDAQHLETRRFQIEDVCRAFRMMPIMVGYSDKSATYASSEQMFIAHVVHCLSPWIERLEQSIDVNLITDDSLFAKFNLNGLMRGAAAARATYYTMMWNVGAMNADDIRDLEDMNPLPDGKGQTYFAPMNAAPLPKPGDDPTPPPSKPAT
jgi:HK97 family phage portal protein